MDIRLCIFILIAIFGLAQCLNNFSKKFAKPGSGKISKESLIFPGTKWCGPGNVAKDENDLGSSSETDACCREHDKCPEYIAAGQNSHGLINDASYTRVHCKCDDEFYKCLRGSKEESTSTTIGFLYFNVLHTKCFKEDHPVLECTEKSYNAYSGNYRCEEYVKNGTAPTKWQWFDVPPYN